MPSGTTLIYAIVGGLVPLLLSPLVLGFRPTPRARPARPSPLAGSVPSVLACTGVGSIAAAVCTLRMPVSVQAVTAVLCVVLVLTSVVDLRVGRLPNLLVLPASVIVAVLLVIAWRDDHHTGSLLRAGLQAGLVLVLCTTTALVLPGSFGMGDARLLALVAGVLAFLSGSGVIAMTFCLTALICVVMVWRRYRGADRRVVPLGPLVAVATVMVLWLAPLPGGRPAVAEESVTHDTSFSGQ